MPVVNVAITLVDVNQTEKINLLHTFVFVPREK